MTDADIREALSEIPEALMESFTLGRDKSVAITAANVWDQLAKFTENQE